MVKIGNQAVHIMSKTQLIAKHGSVAKAMLWAWAMIEQGKAKWNESYDKLILL